MNVQYQTTIWSMAAILHDFVAVVVVAVVRTRPRAMPLAMITMRKSGFPFLSYISMGLRLAELRYNPSRSLRSCTKNLSMKPVFNLKSYGGRFFVLASAILWNDLPQSIKDSHLVETFKQKLKRHLFLQAYSDFFF